MPKYFLMKAIKIETQFKEYESINELNSELKNLMERAVEIRKKAYAPYSQFKVGAAILLEDGTIVLGSNQENAAYPSGLCAERTAIFYAGANYSEKKIIAVAISACSDLKITNTPIAPCGSCRQSMFEYETKQKQSIKVLCMGAEGVVIESHSVNNLLPFNFDAAVL